MESVARTARQAVKTTYRHVQELEARGYVESRHQRSNDGSGVKVKQVYLTDQGRREVARLNGGSI